MADYFDRLIARHAPAAAHGPVTPRVRPRLPGPFERIEALRAPEPLLDEPVPPFAAPLPSPPAPEGQIVREIRTERETVVRHTGSVPRAEGDRTAEPETPAPPLRPAAPLGPGPRPATPGAPRPERRSAAPGGAPGGPRPTAVPTARPMGPAAARPALGAPPSTRAADAGPDRAAARSAAGRRRPRTAERVVHVQIGRLEVSAADLSGPRPAPRPERAGRREPALSLDDYLARGEKRD
ncbi:hypothetical protein [Streptomyces sp. NBRC 110028]|uniref:hypothetical protein n=1 Tax=Streptomyces sp. NBRC 110028 TaxID=1621260 RepID=UPI0006E388B5|nr:hypothetical protein [Streptomyces sp. NBRC 110028]